MKKILLSLAALASVATAVPALAQPFGGIGHRGPPMVEARFAADVNQRVDMLTGRIDIAQRQRLITFRQARFLQNEVRDVRITAQRYRIMNHGRLTGWQQSQLDSRLDRVAAQLNFGRHF